jgi:hypothetical protein
LEDERERDKMLKLMWKLNANANIADKVINDRANKN